MFTSCSEGKQEKTDFQEARRVVSKPRPTLTHFYPQGHTYSEKAVPLNCATPWAMYIQTTTGSHIQTLGLTPSILEHHLKFLLPTAIVISLNNDNL